MAQDARIVVDLLERHLRVPSREEILERYVRAYKGRPVGVASEATPPTAPAQEADVGSTGGALDLSFEAPASGTPAQEMQAVETVAEQPAEGEAAFEEPTPSEGQEAVAGAATTALSEEPAPGAGEDDEDQRPTQMIEAVRLDEGSASSEGEEPDEDEPGEGPEPAADAGAQERTSGRPGKKKKRKKRRGLGAS